MSIHVFNNFNNCFLAGKLPNEINTRFIPVNSNFTNIAEDENFYKLRTLDDLSVYANAAKYSHTVWDTDTYINSDYSLTGQYYNYICSKVESTESVDKPDFINTENVEAFLLANNITDKLIEEKLKNYAKAGFYYIKTREALIWVANRVNDKDKFNNFINIVLGDDILGTEEEPFSLPIIGSADRPYQGTFDGMGHKLVNVTLKSVTLSNGLIGFLGDKGKLCNLQLGDTDSITIVECNKRIDLPHLKLSSANINTGVLVGENYGTVSDIAVFGKFIFKKFVPAVYATTNKTDNNAELFEKSPYDNDQSYSNPFFSDAFCWNSPFNIVPYVGYFAQGIPYSTKYAAPAACHEYTLYEPRLGIANFGVYSAPNVATLNLDYYGDIYEADSYARNNCDDAFRKGTNHDVGANDCAYFFDAYLNVPSKLQHSLRCAYYCSPVIGSNNGINENIYVSATIQADLSGAFVGFIGGICGLQNRGSATKCVSDIVFDQQRTSRKTVADEFARTLTYNLGDLSDSKFAYAGDNAFYLYFRTFEPSIRRSYESMVAVYSSTDAAEPTVIIPACAYFPQYDDTDNCAKSPTSKSNLVLEPCLYPESPSDKNPEPVVITVDKKEYQLYRCAIPNVTMDFSDHDNGNFNIVLDQNQSNNDYPVYGGSASAVNIWENKAVLAYQTGPIYADGDLIADEDGTYTLAPGATPLSVVTSTTSNFSIEWPVSAKDPTTEEIIDTAARKVKISASNYTLTRKTNFNSTAVASISNFKLGVTYGKSFVECNSDDLYIYNDGGSTAISYAGITSKDIAKNITDYLYDNYPFGISFDEIQANNLSLVCSSYKILKLTGTLTGAKSIDVEEIKLSNGAKAYKPKWYNGSRDTVQASIDKAYSAWVSEDFSAKILGTTTTHDGIHADVSNVKIVTTAGASVDTINNGVLKLRSRTPINEFDNPASVSHFDDLNSYVITTTAEEIMVEQNNKLVTSSIYHTRTTLADAAANAAAIYTNAKTNNVDVYKDNYFAVKEPSKSNMTATVGIANSEFSAVKYVEKSIYNVGAYAGMLTVSDGFAMSACSAAYDSIDYELNGGSDLIHHPDIAMFNRFGTLAAKAEIQTNNISNTVVTQDGTWPTLNTSTSDYKKAYINATYAHGLTATDCSFYNTYKINNDTSELSKAIVAEINYLRLPIPSVYQFENGKDRDSKGKDYKIGIWTSDVPYYQHPVTINLWNNSVGSAVWPNCTEENNPHYGDLTQDKMISQVQFASDHPDVYKLFNFNNCKVGQTGITDTKLLTSSYIAALNSINSFSKVWRTYGDHDDGGATTNWNRSNCYFRANTKVMATHDYMAGDTILLSGIYTDKTTVRYMSKPTDHFLRIGFNAPHTVSTKPDIVTAVNFTGSFNVIQSKQIPASSTIIQWDPTTYQDTYFTYTYDVSAIDESAYIQIDEPVKKLSFAKNFNITDMESDLIALKTLICELFKLPAQGYAKDDSGKYTKIDKSSISSVEIKNGDGVTKTYKPASLVTLSDMSEIAKTDKISIEVTWENYDYMLDLDEKREDQQTIKEAQIMAMSSLVQLMQYAFKSITLTVPTEEQDDDFTNNVELELIHPETKSIRHGYVFQDYLDKASESSAFATDYFGNSIHIGQKYKPSYIRSEIAARNKFVYSGAAFTDLAGFLLVDDATKNLISYVDAGAGEEALTNGCWSMKFDQATVESNNAFPFESSALLINITTEEE